MSSFKDTNSLKGTFILRRYDSDGNLLETYEDRNLIVSGGRDAVVRLLGSYTANKNIDRIAFGSNGSAPVVSDSAITDQYAKSVGSISYPSNGAVQFDSELGLAENNGVTIREYGLLAADDTLVARKTRSPIDKTSSIRIEITWIINF